MPHVAYLRTVRISRTPVALTQALELRQKLKSALDEACERASYVCVSRTCIGAMCARLAGAYRCVARSSGFDVADLQHIKGRGGIALTSRRLIFASLGCVCISFQAASTW